MKTGGKNMMKKNLKDFSYKVDKIDKADVTKKEKKDEDKTDQELPPWDVITKGNESKLVTRIGKRRMTLKNAEKLIEDIIRQNE